MRECLAWRMDPRSVCAGGSYAVCTRGDDVTESRQMAPPSCCGVRMSVSKFLTSLGCARVRASVDS